MSQQRLAPERGVVLQQVVDVSHPIIVLARSRTLAPTRLLLLSRAHDRRPVDARDGIRRRLHGYGLARIQHVRRPTVHGDAGGRARAFAYLRQGVSGKPPERKEGERGGKKRGHTRNVMTDELGNTSGLKERLRGHMGVSTSALSDGWTIGPPAESE